MIRRVPLPNSMYGISAKESEFENCSMNEDAHPWPLKFQTRIQIIEPNCRYKEEVR